jgi:hypothetical protein
MTQNTVAHPFWRHTALSMPLPRFRGRGEKFDQVANGGAGAIPGGVGSSLIR